MTYSPSMQPDLNKNVVNDVTGDWGRWQLRGIILIFLCKIPSAWFMACVLFTAPTPQFYCQLPSGDAANRTEWTGSHLQTESINFTDFCHIFSNTYASLEHGLAKMRNPMLGSDYVGVNQIMPCERFEYGIEHESLVTEFDLVCSRTILIAWTQFFHLFGVLTGGILAYYMLDICSPRYLMLLGMITQVVCGCLTGLVNIFELHVFFRYLSAVCCAQMYTAGVMIFSDITGGKYRTSVTCLFETFWSIGVILLPGISYLFPDWTNIYLTISLPTVVYITLWFWIPDSPTWLLKNGQIDRAKYFLVQSATVNNRQYKITGDFINRLQKAASDCLKVPPPAGWKTIWNGRYMASLMIGLHTAWAIYVTSYNGMLLNIRAFGEDYLKVNVAITGVLEIIGVLIAWCLIMKVNLRNKWKWAGLFNIFAGLFSCASFFVPSSLSKTEANMLFMLTAMITKSAVSTAQAVLFTCTSELVTPEKRKLTTFSCTVWARIWLLTAPFIGVLTIVNTVVPLAIFGVCSAIGGVCICIIYWAIGKQINDRSKEKTSDIIITLSSVIDNRK